MTSTPTKDEIRAVACPGCGAEAGSACIGKNGLPWVPGFFHRKRHLAAKQSLRVSTKHLPDEPIPNLERESEQEPEPRPSPERKKTTTVADTVEVMFDHFHSKVSRPHAGLLTAVWFAVTCGSIVIGRVDALIDALEERNNRPPDGEGGD